MNTVGNSDIESVIVPSEAAEAESEESKVREKIERLPRILRKLGAIVLLASAVVFAFQGVGGLDGLSRYLTFLGFTALLCGLGVYLGVRMKEGKGARTVLSVAGTFLPAHFAALGAFVIATLYGTATGLMELFTVHELSSLTLAVTLLGALPLLSIVAYSAFSALVRAEARATTATYLALNALLLLPLRDSSLVGIEILLAMLLLAALEIFHFEGRELMQTKEGLITRLMLSAPIVFLLGRQVVLYQVTYLLLSSVLAAAAVVLQLLLPRQITDDDTAESVQALGVTLGALAWVTFVYGTFFQEGALLSELYQRLIPNGGLALIFLPIALLLIVSSMFARRNGAISRKIGSWLAIASVVLQLLTYGGIGAAFLCLTVSLLTVSGAFYAEERSLLYSGSLGFGISLLYQLRYALDLYQLFSPWVALALLGVAAIYASSYLESNYGKIVSRVRGFQVRLHSWK